MFGKFKNMVNSSISNLKNEIKKEFEVDKTEISNESKELREEFGIKIKEEKTEISTEVQVNLSENSSLDSSQNAKSEQGFGLGNYYSNGKKKVLGAVADVDAETAATIITGAASFLPFMKVLETTDKFGITNSQAFTEKMICNLQQAAKKNLGRETCEKLPEIVEEKLYSKELEQLIDFALIDEVLTEDEKQFLFEKAKQENIDLKEFEAELQRRLDKIAAQKKTEVKLYSQELEQLIELALLDGVLTEQEKQVLFQKAESEGVNLEYFEAVLQGRLNQ